MRDDALTLTIKALVIVGLVLVCWQKVEEIEFLIKEGDRRAEADEDKAQAEQEAEAEREGRGWISRLIGPNR